MKRLTLTLNVECTHDEARTVGEMIDVNSLVTVKWVRTASGISITAKNDKARLYLRLLETTLRYPTTIT